MVNTPFSKHIKKCDQKKIEAEPYKVGKIIACLVERGIDDQITKDDTQCPKLQQLDTLYLFAFHKMAPEKKIGDCIHKQEQRKADVEQCLSTQLLFKKRTK